MYLDSEFKNTWNRFVCSINRDVAFVVHIHVGIVAVVMYGEYKEDSHVDAQYYTMIPTLLPMRYVYYYNTEHLRENPPYILYT